MAAAVGLLLLLLGVSQGLSAHCDARNDGAQCNGILGETVFLRLIHNASGIRIDLLKGNVKLLRWRINITAANKIKDRSDFIPDNGTFRINNLKHNDSGEYKLTVFDSRGEITENRTLHLSVQVSIDTSQLRCGLMFAAAVLICGGIGLYFKWKETKYKKMFITPQRNVNPEDFQVIEQSYLTDV